jgi:hypothetical protein
MTITVTPTVEAGNLPPRIRLNITAGTETSTVVVRNNPDGTTTPVRTDTGVPLPISGGVGLLYDYEAPFGQPVSYSSLESPTTVSNQVTLDIAQPWLIHPGVPALSMPISLRPGSLVEETAPVKQGVFYPMGRTTPVVVTDGSRKSSQGPWSSPPDRWTSWTRSAHCSPDLGPLLLNIPDGMGAGFPPSYIAVGDVKLTRWTDTVIDANRDVTLPFTVVDRPIGGSQSSRTYADLLDFTTYAQLTADYASYTTLLAGP